MNETQKPDCTAHIRRPATQLTPAKQANRALWQNHYRNALRTATCAGCTCACKSARRGCGNFTPSAAFTIATRQAFEQRRSK